MFGVSDCQRLSVTDLVQPELAKLGLTISHLPPPPSGRLAGYPASLQDDQSDHCDDSDDSDIWKTPKVSPAYYFMGPIKARSGSCKSTGAQLSGIYRR